MSKALDVPKSLEAQINETASMARSIGHSVLGSEAEIKLREKLLKQLKDQDAILVSHYYVCLLYTSPSPRDQRGSRMPSSA